MDQKIAVLYARYSSDKQTEQSIEGQISEINRFAEYQGYKIINHYIDRAISGRTDDRPSFLKMVQDSYNKEFQYVIVYKLDRFSRDRYVSETYKHILGLNGVRVISATENISDKPDGILMESMLIGYSEYYSKELAEKVKRGNKESRKKGQYTGGACIYGYKIKDKHYVIDEYESNVVKEIFESILKGLKLNDIATLLNSKGISTNNGYKWSISKIRRIIRNEKYIGIAKFNDEIYTNIVPPIIDKDLFDKANSVLDKNKHVTRDKRGEKYYLTNKLVDSITKASYIGRSSNKCNMNYRYYECKDNNAYFRRLKKSDIETKVIEQVCNYFSNEDNIENLTHSICEFYNSNIDSNTEINQLETKLNSDKTKLSNIMVAIQNGMYSKTLNDKVKELEDTIDKTNTEISYLKSKEQTKLDLVDTYEYLLKFKDLNPDSAETKVAILNNLVKRVEIDRDYLKVTIFPDNVIENKLEESLNNSILRSVSDSSPSAKSKY